MRPAPSRRLRAFTLIEMIAVLAVLAVLLVAALPSTTPSTAQQLQAAADVVSNDLAQARSLAVTYGSTYRVTYDLANNRYTLEHTGSNTTLETLPTWAFRSPSDPADQHIVRLAEIPSLGTSPPKLYRVTVGGVTSSSAYVEFDSLGATAAAGESVIWLTSGAAAAPRYVAVRVNAVTGLTDIDEVTGTGP